MPAGSETGLAPLLLPDPALHKVDIVFVHGLNGHRSRSWTNQASELWPLWLGDDLGGTRAWTYGYDASITIGSKDSIKLHSVRFLEDLIRNGVGKSLTSTTGDSRISIIFVAHSLGGILVKSALYEAHFSKQAHSYIFSATSGVVFLGTPHRGSQWANRLAIAQLGVSMFQSQAELVRLLRAKSEDLATISERFNSIWGTKPVLSCCERRRMLGVGMIVRREHAITNCVRETVVIVDADHRGISKPLSRDTDIYRILLGFLKNNHTLPPIMQSSDDSTDRNSSSHQRLTKGQKQRRKIIHQVLWDQVNAPPAAGQDKWMRIAEEWDSQEKEGQRSHWLGGVYLCRFPPGIGDTTIQIEIDITEEICPVVWMIQTTANNPFYPGRHAGKLEFALGFPMEQIYVIWLTPIFSPFVRFNKGRGEVSSPFDLGKWTPYYTVQHVLQTIANFLALDPLCRTTPPLDHGTLQIPWVFSDLSKVTPYARNEDALFHAAQFFSRAYNRVSREIDNPPILKSQRQASITAIRELIGFFLRGQSPVPEGRSSADHVAAFKAVRTNSEWIAEEKVWADALSVACGFEFFEP